jgi:ADP-heptose:LPS heptosyltransferase
LPALADCKRHHQQAHFQMLLHKLVTEIKKQPQQVEAILQSLLPVDLAAT